MQSTRSENSPVKAGRRVLGEKNTNASLTPSAKRHTDKHKPTIDAIPFKPLKESQERRHTSLEESLHAGTKRTIDQVTESEAEDAEPRKALVTSSPPAAGTERNFQIFDDNSSTRPVTPSREVSPTGVTDAQPSEQLISPQRNEPLREGTSDEPSRSISTSSVPTEPAARRIFIQEKAALARKRLRSAMHRVENNPLDRALSRFEATSRPLVPRGSSIISRTSSSLSNTAATTRPVAPQTSPKANRVLLPALPIQPQSRPVRLSTRTSIQPQASESASVASRKDDQEEEREESEGEEVADSHEEETPKAQVDNQQRPEADVEGMKAALDEADALRKLKELAESSKYAEQTTGR